MEPIDQNDAHHSNHDVGSPPGTIGCLEPADFAALCAAVDACLAGAGSHSRTLVAKAAQALDDLRAELDKADRLIVEQQVRLGKLYDLFADWDRE